MTGESVHDEQQKKKQEGSNGRSGRLYSQNLLDSAFLSANLTQLKLSGSGLSQLPADLPPSDTIVEVDLSRNNLSEIPATLCCLKNLRMLNLSGNQLGKVPEALYHGLHMLRTLNLSGNKLVTFQKPPLCLPLLQSLDLSWNKLVAPPPWLLQDLQTCLEFLDLSGNPCFQLSIRPSQLNDTALLVSKVSDNVKTLQLQNCGIRGVINEKYVVNFKNVKKLDLGNEASNTKEMNIMNDVPILPLKVEELSLAGIGLAGLSKTLTDLPHIRKLNVSRNELHWIPPFIGDLRNLTVIRASESKLYLLPSEMNLLTNLKELYLSHNELSSSDGFENLPSLEVLDLYENQYITLPDFKNLSRLQALDFCHNYVDPPELILLENRMVKYPDLVNCLRSSFLPRSVVRHDSSKAFPVLPESDDDRFSNYSDRRGFEDSDEEILNVRSNGKEFDQNYENEVWELDNDDNFEPPDEDNLARLNGIRLAEEEEELTGQTSQEVKNHPHYFVPFRTASPANLPQDLGLPEEGQFDD